MDDADEPLTLDEACREVFRGKIKPATLRAEATRGRLEIERIGRRDFVTRAAIKRMRELCRIRRAEPASGSISLRVSDLGETERSNAAQAAALASARALRNASGSAKNPSVSLSRAKARNPIEN